MIPGSANPLLLTSADSGYAIERSLRFNSGDSANLSRTPSATGNRKTWTWSGWVKFANIDKNDQTLFSADDGSKYTDFRFLGVDATATRSYKLNLQMYDSGVTTDVYTERVIRDPAAWYHLVLSIDFTQSTAADRVKIYVNGELTNQVSQSGGGATIAAQNTDTLVNLSGVVNSIGRIPTYSEYLDAYLADVHFIDGQALAPTDFGELDDNNVWQPKAYTGNYNISNITYSNYLSAPGGFASGEGATNAFDGSTSTRTKVAVADSIITFDLSSLNLTGSFEFYATNAASEYSLDGGTTWTSSAANSYTTATSDISGVSNIKLKSASGTTMKVTAFKNQGFVLVDNSGTNSFHLDFADNSSNAALGTDTSGNNNTWTVNNLIAAPAGLATANQGMDVVTYTGTGSSQSISSLSFQPDFVWLKQRNTTRDNILFDVVRGANEVLYSNATTAEATYTNALNSFDSNGFTLGGNQLSNENNGTYVAWAWKAGGAATTIAAGSLNSSAYDQSYTWSSSTGYVDSDGTQSSANIFDGNLTTYVSGRPSSTVVTLANSITAQSKIRFYGSWEDSSNSRWAVNGTATNAVPLAYTNNTTFGWSEPTNLTFPLTITSVGALGGNSGAGGRFVAVEVDGKILADSTVTPTTNFPSIASSVSANTSYGFSVVTWTGNGSSNQSVGHNLNAAPKLVIFKRRSGGTSNWQVYHDSIGSTQRLPLNTTDAAISAGTLWGNGMTSSVLGIGPGSGVNTSGSDYVAYAWSEVAGFSKFGSYTGAANLKITTGFKPRFVLIKCTSASGFNWVIVDGARGNSSNGVSKKLYPNRDTNEDNDSRGSETKINFLHDGFQFADQGAETNTGTRTYIYAAFAGQPDGSVIDSLLDTPTNASTPTDTGAGGEVVGNYATLNPLATYTGTLSNGNLKFSTSGGWEPTSATIGVSSGKWYWEYLFEGTNSEVGITAHPSNTGYTGSYQGSLGIGNFGDMYYNGTNSNPFSTFASGSIIGMELDLDNGTFRHYVNGVAQSYATQSLDTSLTWFPSGSVYGSSHLTYNFGQRAFAYQNAGTNRPSADFKCLTTANLPEPTIADGGKYFDTIIASGTGASKTFTMPGGFGPGLVWAKQRNGATNHALFDVVRGATKRLVSNATQAEDTQTNQLSAFTSDGFTYGSDIPNASGNTGVYWAWDAGSSNTTIAAGSLNSSVYNQSQSAWQNYLTTTNGNGFPDSNHPVTWAFDGHLNHHTYTGDDDIYFTPSGGVSFTITSQVRIRSYLDTTVTVETSAGTFGPVTSSSSGTWQWTTVSCSGTLTKITIRRVNGANLSGIEIDGILLVNSGITPATNVPSIASTVRANPSAGFSIVKYTGSGTQGATVGHGLNAVPELVIAKRLSANQYWAIYHKDVHPNVLFFSTSAAASSQEQYNEARPTSSVVEFGSNGGATNTSGDESILYCFAPVEGYSAMGSYTGNGSADGPFVYTGFRPKWLMWKVTQTTPNSQSWYVLDTARDPYNESTNRLHPNSTASDAAMGTGFDLLSNGFKLRSSDTDLNGAYTYIYAAFAENPFKTARAR
jgi:hypothetical protein